MTKNELKAALTAANVTFAKKATLETLQSLFDGLDVVTQDIVAPVDEVPFTDFVVPEGSDIRDCNCPSCGIQLDNGVLTPDDEAANKPGVTLHMEGLNREFNCMGCGAEFGAVIAPYVAPADTHTGTGLKIEKDREERNGIKRPSIGGKCRAIWDALDAHAAATGSDPTAKDVKQLAADNNWNPNNASIEFYQWRKFEGISKPKG